MIFKTTITKCYPKQPFGPAQNGINAKGSFILLASPPAAQRSGSHSLTFLKYSSLKDLPIVNGKIIDPLRNLIDPSYLLNNKVRGCPIIAGLYKR